MDIDEQGQPWQYSEYLPFIYIGIVVGLATIIYVWMLYRRFKYQETPGTGYAISAGPLEVFLLLAACLISSKYQVASLLMLVIAMVKIAISDPKLSAAYHARQEDERRRNRVSEIDAREVVDKADKQNKSMDGEERERKSA